MEIEAETAAATQAWEAEARDAESRAEAALAEATLARDANVSQLYLTHLSRRYREQDVINEARAIFPNTIVARDFDHIKVVKEK